MVGHLQVPFRRANERSKSDGEFGTRENVGRGLLSCGGLLLALLAKLTSGHVGEVLKELMKWTM